MTASTDGATRAVSTLVALAAVTAAGLTLIPLVRWTRHHKASQLCRQRLRRIGVGWRIYRENTGGWPPRDGSDALIALLRSGVLTDPAVLACPAAPAVGAPATFGQGRGPEDRVGYAGRRRDDPLGFWPFGPPSPSTEAIASDDDEGPGAAFNHGDRCHLLYLDGHVEVLELTPRPALGRGRLAPLAN